MMVTKKLVGSGGTLLKEKSMGYISPVVRTLSLVVMTSCEPIPVMKPVKFGWSVL